MARPFDSKSFGRAIQWLRYGSGLSSQEAARRAGISRAHFTAVERGERQPSVQTLERLLDVFDADLTDLQGALSVARSRNFRKRGAPPAPASRGYVSEDLRLLLAVCERPGIARALALALQETSLLSTRELRG